MAHVPSMSVILETCFSALCVKILFSLLSVISRDKIIQAELLQHTAAPEIKVRKQKQKKHKKKGREKKGNNLES